MKKLIHVSTAIALVVTLICCLCSCGASRKVTIADLQEAFSIFDTDIAFEKSVVSDGIEFIYNDSFWDTSYLGKSNKKESVSSIQIINEGIDQSKITSVDKLNKMMTKSAGEMTMNDIKAGRCYLEVTSLCSLLDKKFEKQSVSEINQQVVDLFNGTPIKFGTWTISSTIDTAAETVTIEATQ